MVTGCVAVTGGTGFVGRHVIACLLANKVSVRVLARDRQAAEKLGAVEIVEGALQDEAAVEELCQGVHSVVHIAGVITAGHKRDYEAVNVTATAKIVRVARDAGVKNFILMSSVAAREPELSHYGASKRQGELALRREAEDMVWSILRPPPVYGPGDKGTLSLFKQLCRKLATLPGTERSRFSLIYVTDLAQAVYAMLDQKIASGGMYEIHDGHKHGYSWRDLALAAGKAEGHVVKCQFLPRAVADIFGIGGLIVGRLTGRTPMATPGKIVELYHEDWVARHNLLDQHISWKPEVLFDEGYKKTIAWYREQGWI